MGFSIGGVNKKQLLAKAGKIGAVAGSLGCSFQPPIPGYFSGGNFTLPMPACVIAARGARAAARRCCGTGGGAPRAGDQSHAWGFTDGPLPAEATVGRVVAEARRITRMTNFVLRHLDDELTDDSVLIADAGAGAEREDAARAALHEVRERTELGGRRYSAAPLLCRVAREEAKDSDAREAACKALTWLSSVDGQEVAMVEAGVPETMMHVADEEGPGSRCRRRAIKVIGNLLNKNREAMRDAGTCKIITGIVKEEDDDSECCKLAQKVLGLFDARFGVAGAYVVAPHPWISPYVDLRQT
eukprot:gene36354-38325_t